MKNYNKAYKKEMKRLVRLTAISGLLAYGSVLMTAVALFS